MSMDDTENRLNCLQEMIIRVDGIVMSELLQSVKKSTNEHIISNLS